MIKKILTYINVLLLVFTFFNIKTVNANSKVGEKYFIVTAYYSPLPNQKHYIMGNYEAEKRMNGEGIRGASGKKVFAGMLAAPGNYAFGTKIQLDGIGVGSVEDRGGAIVKAGERNFKHDRIDLWVGHGEEGLQRAMYWGKRTVKGKIVPRNSYTTVNLANHLAPKWATAHLKKNINYSYIPDTPSIFSYGIGTKSTKNNIKELQKFLKKISFYNGEVNGVYTNQLMNTIYSFQRKNNIVKDWSNIYAGYWSHSTRQLILKKYKEGEFSIKKKQESITLNTGTVEQEKIATTGKNSKKIQEQSSTSSQNNIFTKKLQNTADVKSLQEILIELELYNGKIDGEYSSIKSIVLKFQLNNNVIQNEQEIGSGNFGPKTRKKLETKYLKYLEEQKVKKEKQEQIEAEKKAAELELEKKKKIAQNKAKKEIQNLGNIKLGDVSHEVRDFQKILKQLGHFNQQDTAIFGEKTKNSLANFQIENKLIESQQSKFAGVFGPKTKQKMINELAKIYIK